MIVEGGFSLEYPSTFYVKVEVHNEASDREIVAALEAAAMIKAEDVVNDARIGVCCSNNTVSRWATAPVPVAGQLGLAVLAGPSWCSLVQ